MKKELFSKYYTLGDCYDKVGRYADAIDTYKLALENTEDEKNEIYRKLTICYMNNV